MQNNSDIKGFLSELGLENVLSVEQDLGEGYVKLRTSEGERRQALQDIKSVEDIIIELLRNSRDAKAENIFIGTKKIGDKKRLIYFCDDGEGIPEKFHKIIFEARVTSKLENAVKDIYGYHGRGMALFSISLNAEEIKIVFSELKRGTSFFLELDIEKIPEKKDQSVFPQLVFSDGNLNIIGGVNNIARILVEFSIQNPKINIYYGTPSQIVLSMIDIAESEIGSGNLKKNDEFSQVEKLFLEDKKIKLRHVPYFASNYTVLGQTVNKFFNMEISDRTLQRIIYNEFKPLEPINFKNLSDFFIKSKISYNFEENKEIEKLNKDIETNTIAANKTKFALFNEKNFAFRFKDEEISSIINELSGKISTIGEKYLLVSRKDDISVKKSNNNIIINIELKEI